MTSDFDTVRAGIPHRDTMSSAQYAKVEAARAALDRIEAQRAALLDVYEAAKELYSRGLLHPCEAREELVLDEMRAALDRAEQIVEER